METHVVRPAGHKLLLVLLLSAFSITMVDSASAASGRTQGKLWVVSVTQASNVVFPPPTAIPDATFTTNGIAYIGQFLGTNPATHCFTIGRFLGGCPTPVFKLKYSGLPNPYLGGAAAGPKTAMGGTTYGIIIEFTGWFDVANGGEISIFHDDGVSLMIDGDLLPGFGAGVNFPVLDSVTFTGATGTHYYDLLYGNVGEFRDGAWLLFFPSLF